MRADGKREADKSARVSGRNGAANEVGRAGKKKRITLGEEASENKGVANGDRMGRGPGQRARTNQMAEKGGGCGGGDANGMVVGDTCTSALAVRWRVTVNLPVEAV